MENSMNSVLHHFLNLKIHYIKLINKRLHRAEQPKHGTLGGLVWVPQPQSKESMVCEILEPDTIQELKQGQNLVIRSNFYREVVKTSNNS